MSAATAVPVRPSITKEPMPDSPPIDPRAVGNRIMVRLGDVPGFKLVRAVRVTDHNFRVNVWSERPGKGLIPDNYIAHSFMVWVDDAGEIIRSEPLLPTEPFKGQ